VKQIKIEHIHFKNLQQNESKGVSLESDCWSNKQKAFI